jgi:beta-glucosidase
MDDNDKRTFESVIDPIASPLDSVDTATTPGTEFSPPVSPVAKKASLRNSRNTARDKLKGLTQVEKVAVSRKDSLQEETC